MANDNLKKRALWYHQHPVPGKISIKSTKPLSNQHDLSLAYSPGVAAACEEIADEPEKVANYTSRGNLVAVISNGTAVLGLGAIGPLASKPVMEGKAVLFKKFADIDVFDIEVDELDPDKFVDIVKSLEPTFGGINLEDIKAPECFYIEDQLKKQMNIPVFHDDQHGTAIIVAAAIVNALHIVGKDISSVKLVTSGAGAAAIACLDLLVDLGLPLENIWVTDIHGLVYEGRPEEVDERKKRFCQKTDQRTLDDAIEGADIFLGLSVGNIMDQEKVLKMVEQPIIFALANPTPEISPDEVKKVRPNAIVATGRSDYPNQVNNVLCFPFIFRGAMDVGATAINEEMKKACVYAIADLARVESSEEVHAAYGDNNLKFGPDYIIPKPFDPRLILKIAPAVAKAAMDSGVAKRPIEDFDAYNQKISEFVFRSGMLMKPVFSHARKHPQRVAFAEGEEYEVLRAVQVLIDEKLAKPILIGRPAVIDYRIKKLGLRIDIEKDLELVNIYSDPRYNDYWGLYHRIMQRRGVSPDEARAIIRSNPTAIAAIMLRRGEADALICGIVGRFHEHLRHVKEVIGMGEGVQNVYAMNVMIMDSGVYFICDTYVNADPTSEQIAEMTLLAAEEVRRFGIKPKVALLSHSNFGTSDNQSAVKMKDALKLILDKDPYLEVEGEMHADAALSEDIRHRVFPNSRLKGQANMLVMPTLDAANITLNSLKMLGEGLSIGPILLGTSMPAHILTESSTVRRIVNMSALTSIEKEAMIQHAKEEKQSFLEHQEQISSNIDELL